MKRMKMVKKGFTLIELLAVIVILAIIMLIAGQNIFGIMGEAEKGAFRTEFLSFLDSAQTAAQFDIMNGVINASNGGKCYAMSDLADYFEQKDGYNGSVRVDYDNGSYTITGWFYNTKYMIDQKDKTLTTADVQDLGTTTGFDQCR